MLNVKKTSNFLIAFILLFSFCFSCKTEQKELNQNEKLQIDFYVRYMQSDKQVKAEISFSNLDSIKKIMPKRMEEVLFQSIALDGKRILNQYKYQITTENPFSDNYKFFYRDSQQETQEQQVTINPITDFTLKKNKISKQIGSTITFDGKVLENNEELILLISDENNKTSTIKISEPSKDFMISIFPEQIANLSAGKGTIYVVRQQTIEENKNNTLLKGRTEYYTSIKELEIIE